MRSPHDHDSDDSIAEDVDIDASILEAFSDPRVREQMMEVLARLEETDDTVTELLDDAAERDAKIDQNRSMVKRALEQGAQRDAEIRRLEQKMHYGKEARKEVALFAAEERADERDNGRGRLLVEEAQDIINEEASVSQRTVRTYLRELAQEYEGVQYKQATEPKYLGRNVKALYLDYKTFWEHHNVDDIF
jgi:hypothetical protein